MKRTKSMVYNPTTESRELFLVATNDGNLYRQMIQPILANLTKKASKGIYDSNKSEMVWHGMADELPDHYLEAEIQSWDVPSDAHMTFNV